MFCCHVSYMRGICDLLKIALRELLIFLFYILFWEIHDLVKCL